MTAEPIEVRVFKHDDRAALTALSDRLTIGVATWRNHDAVLAAVRRWIELSMDLADDPERAVFVATAVGSVVGVVTLTTSTHFSGEVDAYVGELVTAEHMEGRGVGQALIAAAETWTRERGLRCLTLDTGAANHRARHFYQRVGFLEEDVRLTKVLGPVPEG